MKLDLYFEKHDVSVREFAKRCSVAHTTILRIRKYGQVPRRDLMDRIVAETGGQVTHADFVTPISEDAA